jgi:hypothetical protein
MTGSEAQAMKLLDDYMAAFNARDLRAYAAKFNYPFVRLVSGRVIILNGPDSHRPDMFEWLASRGWHHSAWDRRRIIHSSEDKVHFDTRFTRYREDGSTLGTYDALYVVTNQNDHWGLQAQSSFAP